MLSLTVLRAAKATGASALLKTTALNRAAPIAISVPASLDKCAPDARARSCSTTGNARAAASALG